MLRKIIFWAHLVAGLIAGLAIGVMCFTGATLAFEKEVVAWAERDVRRVAPPPPEAKPLPLAELQRRFVAAQPAARPTTLIVQNDPRAAVAFSAGRTGGFYVDRYSGEIRSAAPTRMAAFLQTMTAWHRTLGFTGETTRPRGKLINGVCNLAFCALAITGLYLWMPRQWSWRALRPVIWFRPTTSAKARDFNWHNVIGLWSAPVLIVLTLTAIPISFQWGGRLIGVLAGSPSPASSTGVRPGGGARDAGPVIEISPPDPAAQRLEIDTLFAVVRQQVPEWKTVTLRLGRASANTAPVFNVRSARAWPRTSTITLVLDPFTGAVLRRSGYADLPGAQQVRSWTRFLHTGEALGWGGQLVACLACLAGLVLVWTGAALACRRYAAARNS